MNNDQQQRSTGPERPESGSTVPGTLEEVLLIASQTTRLTVSGSTVLLALGEPKS